jgi:DNA-binding HxlR family transcriptional regulator
MKKRYRGYAQVCPLAKAAELLCERWTLLVLREMMMGSRRFSELRRGIPAVSPTMLSQRLRELADARVVVRLRPTGAGRGGAGSAEYELTQAGQELAPILRQLSVWGHRHAVADLRREDMEPSYLMWVAHKTLRLERSTPARVVIAYELLDAPLNRQRWWIVAEHGEVELCFKHPGFPVDLKVCTRLRPMSLLILGKMSPVDAVRTGAVKLQGSSELARTFVHWYPRTFDYVDATRPAASRA